MKALTGQKIKELQLRANDIRQTIIEMLVSAGSGHTAGPLGMADIFAALYFHVMKHDPKNPDWPERDRLILSNGHIVPVRYSAMAHAGYFPIEECLTLRKFGSRLQGHPERESMPGLETTSGPLGSGLSQAAGYAYSARMDASTGSAQAAKFRVFCAMSDGEHNEGNTWEGAMFAAKFRLTNLIGIIDRNFIQIDGNTEDVMPLEPLGDKYRAFGWHVIDIDGNDIKQFVSACEEAKTILNKPTLILARTIPGKGIKSIENDYLWHGKPPTKDESVAFLSELRAAREELLKQEK
ncbi:MAG: transketolase [Patescibacteria group bacterium]